MTVKSRGAILAAALIGGLVLLWWMLRKNDQEPDPIDPDLRYDPAELEKLPNYRPAKDSRVKFASHDEFVRTLDQELIKRFPRKGARSILIAHAATGGGWHIKDRPALYHWNLWGQTVSSKMIAEGVPFTILKPRLKDGQGKAQAFRAFSSAYEALMEGYLPNIKSYVERFNVEDPVKFLDERGDGLTLSECVEYITRINAWFAKAERTPAGIATRAGKWMWIYTKFCKGKLL